MQVYRRTADWAYERDQRIEQKRMAQTIAAFQQDEIFPFKPRTIHTHQTLKSFVDRLKEDRLHREMKRELFHLAKPPQPTVCKPFLNKGNRATSRLLQPRKILAVPREKSIPQINPVHPRLVKTVTYASIPVFARLTIGRKNLFLQPPTMYTP